MTGIFNVRSIKTIAGRIHTRSTNNKSTSVDFMDAGDYERDALRKVLSSSWISQAVYNECNPQPNILLEYNRQKDLKIKRKRADDTEL